MQSLFWTSFALLVYAYLGYGGLIFVLSIFYKRKPLETLADLPSLTVVVPAFNEEAVIEKKIQNSLLLNYPPGKLRFLFVTEGSTDRTNEIIQAYSQLMLLTGPHRKGKTAAINRAMQAVQTPVVVFTDANTLLHQDSLLRMVQHYADETVGGVAGEKRILEKENSAVGLGERLYWQYESWLKKANANFYTVIGAAGELFSIRTILFKPVREDVILDDFVISAGVCRQGYRFVYEAGAYATETASASVAEERKRKVRISAGCFQALALLGDLLNPFHGFRLSFQYFSHRVLRWTLCPLCLVVLFFSNGFLALTTGPLFYHVAFLLQVIFYGFAIIGRLLLQKKKMPTIFLVPYYFVFMNVSLCTGLYLFLAGKQTVIWQKAIRKSMG